MVFEIDSATLATVNPSSPWEKRVASREGKGGRNPTVKGGVTSTGSGRRQEARFPRWREPGEIGKNRNILQQKNHQELAMGGNHKRRGNNREYKVQGAGSSNKYFPFLERLVEALDERFQF